MSEDDEDEDNQLHVRHATEKCLCMSAANAAENTVKD